MSHYVPAGWPDLEMSVVCPKCEWAGKLKYANHPPQSLVTCPKCGTPVEKSDNDKSNP